MAASPFFLREQGKGDARVLDDAWSDAPTFAFLPAKSSVDDEWVERALDSLPDDLLEAHFALLTSGSTGHPKLIVGSRRRAEELARVLHDVQSSETCGEAILTLPLSYCYAFVNQWLWARVMGRRLIETSGFAAPDDLLRSLNEAKSAMVCLVGAQLALFDTHFGDAVFPGVARVHFAGGPFPQAELSALARRFPNARIYNNYGCAEAMPRLTIRRAEDGDNASDVGCALPGVELSISGGGGDGGGSGEMRFRSPFGAVAFVDEAGFRRPSPDEWIPTGDHAEAVGDGRVRLLGRADQVFKRYGEKIALGRLLDTAQTAWTGTATFYREKDRMNEEGFVLLLSPTPAEEDVRAILKAFRANHPRTHWPLRVESAERLPALPNGKTDLAALASLESKRVHWRNRI